MLLVEVANLVRGPRALFVKDYSWKVISVSSWCSLVLVVLWDLERWL
jgi:hypothetical protein